MSRRESILEHSISPMRSNAQLQKLDQPFQNGRKSQKYISPTFSSSQCFYPHLTPQKEIDQNIKKVDVVKMRDKYQEIFQKNYRRSNYFPRELDNNTSRAATPINQQQKDIAPTPRSSHIREETKRNDSVAKPSINQQATLLNPQNIKSLELNDQLNLSFRSISRKSHISKSNSEFRRFSDYHGYKKEQNNVLNSSTLHEQTLNLPSNEKNELSVCVNCFNQSMVTQRKINQSIVKQDDQSFVQNIEQVSKFFEDVEYIKNKQYKRHEREDLMDQYKKNQESKRSLKSVVQREKEDIQRMQADEISKDLYIQDQNRQMRLRQKENFYVDLQKQVQDNKKFKIEEQQRQSRIQSTTSFTIGEEYDTVQSRRQKHYYERNMLLEQREQKVQQEKNSKSLRQKENDLERRVQQEFLQQDHQVSIYMLSQQQSLSLIQKRIQQQSMQRDQEQKQHEKTQQKVQHPYVFQIHMRQKEEEYSQMVKSQDALVLNRHYRKLQIDKLKQQALVDDLSTQIQQKRDHQNKIKAQEKSQDQKLLEQNKSFDYLTKPIHKVQCSNCDCCKNKFLVDHLTRVKKQ